MKLLLVLVVSILFGCAESFKVQSDSGDTESFSDSSAEDQLLLMIQMTRHGARSTISTRKEPNVNTKDWEMGLGELTPSGERQHYLLGNKQRRKFITDEIHHLSEDFDPREVYVISTNYNRTIMSAYSENQGWYPLGSVEEVLPEQKNTALPPFEIDNIEETLNDLGNDPTMHGYQPIPIHVGGDDFAHIFQAHDAKTCPVVNQFAQKVRDEAKFTEINEKYKDNILKQIRENWEVDEDLDFKSVGHLADQFYTAYFDDRLVQKYQLPVETVDKIMADQFYYFNFYFDEMVRIATSNFLNFLYSTFDAKILSTLTDMDDVNWIKSKKLIYISAHDSTAAAVLSGIEQKQEYQPFYATHNLIQLWKKAGTNGDKDEDYYVKWIYNDKALNINNKCDEEGRCPYDLLKEYLKSREYQGDDWLAACKGTQSNWLGGYHIILSTFGGVVALGFVSYLMMKKFMIHS
ncbi:unnamed protein product [Moneuplotes crassus]|uniref:Uncharacterized protein n=1 Tax=Euplotes crassus TaxID=5936 RepID=A0AAD1UR55_EUPCR|nr:unnamed protein product [Moneuplotes crassus]